MHTLARLADRKITISDARLADRKITVSDTSRTRSNGKPGAAGV